MAEWKRGKITISELIDRTDNDFADLVRIAGLFADMGRDVNLTPKKKRRAEFDYDSVYGSLRGTKYYGKCPDMNVGGMWYEYEVFVPTTLRTRSGICSLLGKNNLTD